MLLSLYLLLLLFLLFLSAFFSGSETALFSLEHLQVKEIREDEPQKAVILDSMLKNPRKLLIGLLIGNTLVNVTASIVAAAIMGLVFGQSTVVLFWSILLMTALLLIVGEITPKNYAILNNKKMVLVILVALDWFINLFNPLIGVFIRLLDWLLPEDSLSQGHTEPSFSEEEVDTLLKVTKDAGVIGEKESELLRNILDFGDITVESVMTPRTELTGINVDTPLSEIVGNVRNAKHRCLPVYKGSLDNIVGKVKAKNLLINQPQTLEDVMEPMLFIPKDKKVDELLSEMRQKRKNIAIVVDEYGGTDGLVTLEDLIEELVGEILDEFDEKENLYIRLDNNMYKVRGKMRIDEFNDILGLDLPEEETDTLNGFLSLLAGAVPVKNQRISYKNIDFYIEKASEVKVLEVLVKINKM